MNFAGVYAAPTIFLCQNNGWAISMSRSGQTASATIAQKADAYGMPGALVDGNDVFAVLTASRAAVARARAGDGPTLIEALTYRVGPHTTTDDAGRYRSDDDVAGWRTKDPIDRLRAHLQQQDAWDEAWERGVEEAASSEIEAAVERAEALAPFPADGMFDRVYAQPTAVLDEQRTRQEAGDE
jgi:TPP-dependent pyruvate/acetoin dehydrogenase alpha subunit